MDVPADCARIRGNVFGTILFRDMLAVSEVLCVAFVIGGVMDLELADKHVAKKSPDAGDTK